MDDRSSRILKTLIQRYLLDGQPGIEITMQFPAFGYHLRQLKHMADLENMGFVTSTHTSAGRIPLKVQDFSLILLKVNPIKIRLSSN